MIRHQNLPQFQQTRGEPTFKKASLRHHMLNPISLYRTNLLSRINTVSHLHLNQTILAR